MKTHTTSFKRLVAALAILALVTSCSKSDGLPSSSDSQSRSHKGGGSTGGDTSIPQVTGLSATVLGPTTVYLTWNSLSGATSYWIYRNNTVIAIMTSTNYTDNYATPGVSYTYAVAPVVNSVLGPQSASVTVTPH
jgi:hypothetical protein